MAAAALTIHLSSGTSIWAIFSLRRFTPRIFWIVSLAVAGALGAIVAIPQWLLKQARLDDLRSHVAQISRLAASVVDGDQHRQLLERTNYTPELYERALAPLVRFHSADPRILSIYTVGEHGGKRFFILDTAASGALVTRHELSPSGYLEAFEPIDAELDADGLRQIALGRTYVHQAAQSAEYGTFLSAHTPVRDSHGQYSGFVSVAFDIADDLAQEATFRAIWIGTLAASSLLALLIGYMAALYHCNVSRPCDRDTRLG